MPILRFWYFSFNPLRNLSVLCISAVVFLQAYHRRDAKDAEVAQRNNQTEPVPDSTAHNNLVSCVQSVPGGLSQCESSASDHLLSGYPAPDN